jgi:hypothetical protein
MTKTGGAEGDLPDVAALSPGAISLLALAAGAHDDKTRQRRQDIVGGSVFKHAFEILTGLPEVCRTYLKGEKEELYALMGTRDPPANLFDFFVSINDTLWRQVADRAKRCWDGPDRLTGFDHSSFLALVQPFAEKLGFTDGLGPPFDEAVEKIARLNPRDLQQRFLVHYLGNVMQDYFDAAAIRRSNPGLPADTEQRLREDDAETAGAIVFGGSEEQTPLEWPKFLRSVKRFFGAVVLLESEQHDLRRG